MAAEVTLLTSSDPDQAATTEITSTSSAEFSAPPPATEPPSAPPRLSPQDAVDFLLHPSEIERGRTAAENFLSSFRNEASRLFAEDALETLATVISGGRCDTVGFPWQQVRPFHGAAALTILKEKGAPARIEALRCRRDTTRNYRVVPEAFPPGQVQKIRTTLTKVIEQCSQLGFVVEEEPTPAVSDSKKSKATARGRLLGDGELCALGAACSAQGNAEGGRDAVFFALVNCGLKIAEITALRIESVRFNNKTGVCNIVAGAASGSARGRRVELSNNELILLEDWLDHRGDGNGPLLCTVGRGGKIEGKRLTMSLLKDVCELRGKQAEVADFLPNDLSRSADALLDHRKAVRKKATKQAQSSPSPVERLLYVGRADLTSGDGEAIRFPFQGLAI